MMQIFSSVAQWQSNRLLTDRSLVQIQPGEHLKSSNTFINNVLELLLFNTILKLGSDRTRSRIELSVPTIVIVHLKN